MTFDLGRVTTILVSDLKVVAGIAVTFDLGRVTTLQHNLTVMAVLIAVTFDLGRVTTELPSNIQPIVELR